MPATRGPRSRFAPPAPALAPRALAVAFALIAAFGLSNPASAADWQWTIAPYAWLTDVGVDATVNDRDLSGDTEFGEREVRDLPGILPGTVELKGDFSITILCGRA